MDSTHAQSVGSRVGTVPKLTKLTEGDNVEAYLTTFERTMTAYRVEQNWWSYMLAPQLTGKAQKEFSAMAVERAGDYSALKEAILLRYDITEEAYRQLGVHNEARGLGVGGHRKRNARRDPCTRVWVYGNGSRRWQQRQGSLRTISRTRTAGWQ